MNGAAASTVLGIDTSAILGGVAVARGDRLLAELRCDARAAASERILPQISRLLEDLELARGEIRRVGVALGPGSFTGLRVGLTTAKGLCQGLGIPLVGVSSLEARMRALAAPGRGVLVATAHRRGQLFCAAGWLEGNRLEVLLPEESRALDDAATWVQACLENARRAGVTPLLCTGDAAELLLAHLAPRRPAWEGTEVVAAYGQPGAVPGSVALMAAAAGPEEFVEGLALDDLMPRYLRGTYTRRASAAAVETEASGGTEAEGNERE